MAIETKRRSGLGAHRQRRRVVAGITAAVLGVTALAGCWSPNQQKDLDYINASRRANGRGSVWADDPAMNKAQAWSEHMARTGVLEHTGGGGRMNTSGLHNWCAAAENVGMGTSTWAVHQAFLRSSAHRNNMLGSYDRVGTGVVRRGSVVWVTEIYLRSC